MREGQIVRFKDGRVWAFPCFVAAVKKDKMSQAVTVTIFDGFEDTTYSLLRFLDIFYLLEEYI